MALHSREGQPIQVGGTVGYQQQEALRINDEQVEQLVDFDAPQYERIKSQLNLSHDEDDIQILRLRQTAVDYFERVTSHYIKKQKRRVTFDAVTRQFEIPAVPWQSLEGVTVVNQGDKKQVGVDGFFVEKSPLSVVTAKTGTQLPQGDALRVTYTAGYDSKDDVPGAVAQSITMMVADLYEHRTSAPIVGQTLEDAPFDWSRLLSPHRVVTT
jgi:uncharacterized phiE125 gp8 family phage protein